MLCRLLLPAAQTTTAGSEVLIFGGHADDINWFRSYNHGSGALWSTEMSSGRWCVGVVGPRGRKGLPLGEIDARAGGKCNLPLQQMRWCT